MPTESKAARRARARWVLDRLAAEMPQARIELQFGNPLELLVSVLLSAQCTDARVNAATPPLFAKYRSAADYAAARPEELEPFLQSLGLFRAKARHLVQLGRALVASHGGKVPADRDALQALPGVGRKTAGVVAMHLGQPVAFPVDTHVFRIAHRLGLSKGRTPDQVEADLLALYPRERWTEGHHLFIWHGRRTCLARTPACERCAVLEKCPTGKRNVKA